MCFHYFLYDFIYLFSYLQQQGMDLGWGWKLNLEVKFGLPINFLLLIINVLEPGDLTKVWISRLQFHREACLSLKLADNNHEAL